MRVPGFADNQYFKVVRLSALRTGRLYQPSLFPENNPGVYLLEAELTPGAIVGPEGL